MRLRAARSIGLAIGLIVVIALVLSLRTCADATDPTTAPTLPIAPTVSSHENDTDVIAPARRRASVSPEVAPNDPGQPGVADAEEASAVKPARLVVVVKHADGSPAAGVRVVVATSDQIGGGWFGGSWNRAPDPLPPQTTDAEGRTTFEAEHLWIAWASASDGDEAAIAPRRVALRAGEEASVTLTLGPSFRVRGEVVDLDGRRVRVAHVRMLVQDVLATGSSSVGAYAWALDPVACTDGAFEFAGVLPRTRPVDEVVAWQTPSEFTIEAHADGFLSARAGFAAEVASLGAPVTVTLLRTGAVRGRCTDGDGRVVVARGRGWGEHLQESFEHRKWSTATDANGRFEFTDFPEIGGSLDFARGAFASRTAAVPQFDPRVGHDLGEILLAGGSAARGRVVAPDGTAVAGASVWFGDAQGTTDDGGHFLVERLRPGPWHVYVQDDIGRRKASLDLDDISEPVTIVASNDRHVRLQVLFEQGSEPPDDPPYMHVLWRRPEEDASSRVHEQWHRGRYEIWFQPKAAGRWIVRVEIAGWEPTETPIDVIDGRAIEASLKLRKSGR